VRFANPEGLRAIGDSQYEECDDWCGDPIEGNPGDGGLGIIRDRALECSNVDLIQECIQLQQLKSWYEVVATTLIFNREIEAGK
jgi:flagellar basal-body rod protein FlgG